MAVSLKKDVDIEHRTYRVGVYAAILFPGWLRDPGLRYGTPLAFFITISNHYDP
jgi:hypothetical protein